MPRPTDPDRRPALLDEAVSDLARHGLAGLSLRPLADRLGVSTYALTYHFGSKQGLLNAVVNRALERQAAELTDVLASTAGPADAVRAVWGWMATRRDENRLVWEVVVVREPPLNADLRRRAVATWVSFVAEGLAARGMPTNHARREATKLYATLSGLELAAIAGLEEQLVTETVEIVAEATAMRWAPPRA